MTGAELWPSLGVRAAQVFTVFSVLDSTEGERWQVGSRFSPRNKLPLVRFQKSSNTHVVSKEMVAVQVSRNTGVHPLRTRVDLFLGRRWQASLSGPLAVVPASHPRHKWCCGSQSMLRDPPRMWVWNGSPRKTNGFIGRCIPSNTTQLQL